MTKTLARAFLLALLCIGTAAAEDRFLDSRGARIRYVDEGRGEAVGARAAAYDELGEDVIRLLDHLKIERAHAVGYSLGGIILARLLVTHPTRFASAVLGGAAYRRSRSEASDRAADEAAKEIEAGVYRALIVSTAPTDEPPPSEEAIRARSREIAASADVKAHAALMRARRALLVSDAEVAKVRVPALAVAGSADPALPRIQAMKKRWPFAGILEAGASALI